MVSPTSYRLEAPRPRAPPPPIRVNNTSFRPPSLASYSDQTLLYDLPTSATSPPPHSGYRSPTSPNSREGKRRTSSPASRARSATPSVALQSDTELFADRCRAWYYKQDEESGRLMTQTLATLPPSQRAPFARLQASVRSGYHAHMTARRNAEFRARLTAMQPGGSLMPHARADPTGAAARKERLERLGRFVHAWCTMGMPGTKPFFEGLWALMRLQVVPRTLGGAGAARIEWEIDDAVFKEAAGKDFMLEAVDVLKGVLAFEESASKRSASWSRPGSSVGVNVPASAGLTRARSRTIPSPTSPAHAHDGAARLAPPISSTTAKQGRARAPSDPFSDGLVPGFPKGGASLTPSPTVSRASSASTPEPDAGDGEVDDFVPSPLRTALTPETLLQDAADGEDADEYVRVWTAPDLPNEEYLAMLKMFPAFISQRPLPRFPPGTTPAAERRRAADLEEGIDDDTGGETDADTEGREIRFGTGRMWLGRQVRRRGWQGGWWTRFFAWWRRVFC